MKKFVIALAFVVFFVACDGNQPKPVNENEKINSGEVKPASTTSGGTYGSSPTSGGDTTAAAPAAGANTKVPEPEKPAELVNLEKEYEKNPSNAENKKKLVQATYELGRKIEYDEALPPFVKYRQALKLFKRALELDPTHKESLAEKEQIEAIYRSMGRPVPEV
ncbi:MAG: tetratricopeptide repeat protein [Blastocatellia bacterium]|nr:tetratricopeptide repeat protein [Blastocatellia bacterium]MBN8721572.1 tetratricopeptide repeat protein [Acidobacteriota bacterium]